VCAILLRRSPNDALNAVQWSGPQLLMVGSRANTIHQHSARNALPGSILAEHLSIDLRPSRAQDS
jgi:hypothetical protein